MVRMHPRVFLRADTSRRLACNARVFRPLQASPTVVSGWQHAIISATNWNRACRSFSRTQTPISTDALRHKRLRNLSWCIKYFFFVSLSLFSLFSVLFAYRHPKQPVFQPSRGAFALGEHFSGKNKFLYSANYFNRISCLQVGN